MFISFAFHFRVKNAKEMYLKFLIKFSQH